MSIIFLNRCRHNFRRHRFVFALIVAAFSTLAGVCTWTFSGPSASFDLLRISIATNASMISEHMFDETSFLESLGQDLSQIFSKSLSNAGSTDLSPQAVATKKIMEKTLHDSLPVILKSALQISRQNQHSLDPSSNFRHLLPVLFQVNPTAWDQWIDSITAGNIELGACRVEGARAACELFISGPEDQRATVALLWKRKILLWHLTGIIGTDRIITAMRSNS